MENIITFEELYGTDFDIRFQIAAKQYWSNRNTFSCMSSPKPNDMLLYLHGCSAEYTLPDGTTLTAPKKSIVYAPTGARYLFRPFDITEGEVGTFLVNFTLCSENGAGFILDSGVKIIEYPNCGKAEALFTSLASEFLRNDRSRSAVKADLYAIFAELCGHFHRQNILSPRFQVISKGIFYLEEDPGLELSVSEIAKLCSVSEIYFRRLFKEYSGITPARFKINRKIERAKQLLFEGKNVKETADALCFGEAPYFCRIFKERTGLTPGEYVKKYSGIV